MQVQDIKQDIALCLFECDWPFQQTRCILALHHLLSAIEGIMKLYESFLHRKADIRIYAHYPTPATFSRKDHYKMPKNFYLAYQDEMP